MSNTVLCHMYVFFDNGTCTQDTFVVEPRTCGHNLHDLDVMPKLAVPYCHHEVWVKGSKGRGGVGGWLWSGPTHNPCPSCEWEG